jgi:sugar phosphate isomerase/epimerase
VLNAIEASGYTGFVTVELYTYEHAAAQAARQAFQYLQQWREQAASTA